MSQEFHIEEATVMQKFLHKLLATPKVMDLDAIKCEYLRICDSFLDKYESMNKNDQIYYKDAHLLFKRLKEKMHQHLAFVSNNVPYTNNMIERDFRHIKTKMKVSSTFRS
jgi:hypothetical protein